MLVSTLLGRPIFNIKPVLKRTWPECTGTDILADNVYSICKGVVVFVGLSTDNDYVVNVQIDATQFIRYCNLKSEAVSPNQAIKAGDKIGVADEYVRVEYCNNTIPETNCVRLGGTTYYKHDPYPILTGESEIQISGRSAYELALSGKIYDPTQLIKEETITPFIATLSPSVTYIDIKGHDSMGVVGYMVYGGGLFDDSHMKKSQYISNTLKGQLSTIEKANKPYGIYVDVRARSIAEAKEECKQLYYLIVRHSPKLGIWLKLNLVKSKTINDTIIDVYKENMIKWGMSGHFGFYVTKSQLENISWDIHKEDSLLWLISHTSRIDAVEQLLTPEFFKL